MIRDEICVCSESPRSQRKSSNKTPWVLILLLLVAGAIGAHVAGLTEPLASIAAQFGLGGGRNMRTPFGRLVGEWESEDDPMFRRICQPKPKKGWSGTGLYVAHGGSGDMTGVTYKIIFEDCAGTNLEMAEFLPAANLNLRAQYSVAKDGLTMTRSYDRGGTRVSCRYRYVGPPTESVSSLVR